ncbi:unnamed protein product [Allacma fusca]|uniref:Uncharacterized protein n=1 Tax=Allacma fusca TaxID=39272 RepID=A0A8J2LKP8_9HEXA|nr:unnamed protein product [Allacma fusca]
MREKFVVGARYPQGPSFNDVNSSQAAIGAKSNLISESGYRESKSESYSRVRSISLKVFLLNLINGVIEYRIQNDPLKCSSKLCNCSWA